MLTAAAAVVAKGQQPPERRPRSVAATMRMLDKDGDGQITYEEYMRPARRSVEGWDGGDAEDAEAILGWYTAVFDKADLDHDDALGDDETRFLLCIVSEALTNLRGPSPSARDHVGARSTENLFKHADADGDGFVRDDEYFQHMVTRTAPLEWGEVDTFIEVWQWETFLKADVEKDGALTPDEFHFSVCLVKDDLSAGKFAERSLMTKLFRGMDANNDGKITPKEAKQVIASGHGQAERYEQLWELWELSPAYDENKDGCLDRSEAYFFAEELKGQPPDGAGL